MFIISYVGMVISYYLLGQATTVPGFLVVFMLVAAAIFKPLVVGTVARVTDGSNSSTGFGIFYTDGVDLPAVQQVCPTAQYRPNTDAPEAGELAHHLTPVGRPPIGMGWADNRCLRP